MKKFVLTALVAAAGIGITVTAVAAGRGGHGGHGRAQFAAMDTNGNGSISATEAQAYFADRAAEIDTNNDNAVTMAEVKAFHEAERQRRQQERFLALDANKDGRVSTEEFAASRIEWVMGRDADGDGEVEAGEGRGRRHGRNGG